MLRFPCIGDIHAQHTHRRNPERLQALDQIIDESVRRGDVAAWLVLGDVFHQRSSIEDRNDIAPRWQRMADVAPVVAIYGNHDQPGDLHILGRLKAAHAIYVVDRPQVIRLVAPTGQDVAIFGCPYPHKGSFVAAGADVSHGVRNAAAPLLDAIFLDAAEQLRQADADGAITLVIGHGTIAGAMSSVGQPMGLERDIAIDAALLARLGDMPKIFGHIHKPQEIHGAYYAGSIGRNDWGECEDKRYLEVEWTDEDTAVRSYPIGCTPLYHVEANLTTGEFTYRVTRGPDGEALAAPASWAGCEVRVRYRFNADEKAGLDHAQILAEFATAKRLELDPIAVRNRAIRSEEVAKATTLTEKVAAFVRQSGREWTPALDAKLAALQGVDGAAFLTEIGRAPGPSPVSLDSEELQEITL